MSNPVNNPAGIPIVILCGGIGIFIDESGQRTNKALVRVAGKSMVAWVILHYARAGFRRFILAAGYQHTQFAQKLAHDLGATIENNNRFSLLLAGTNYTIELVPTPVDATTGDRLNACRSFLNKALCFGVTYSDTLSDVNLTDLYVFHNASNKIATLVAAEYPVRFRILGMRLGETTVRGFSRKPVIEMAPINGGFYFFNQSVLTKDYLNVNCQGIVLENEVLNQLASNGMLGAYAHKGLWQNLDSERDLKALTLIANKQLVPSYPA
jgi:glucose-1-phosphate cytidylyltransferase